MVDKVIISQNKVCDKISIYWRLIYDEMSLEEQRLSGRFYEYISPLIKRGICFGFSVVYSYMVSVNKEAWWLDLLGDFCSWDEQLKSLSSDKRMQYNRLINYLLFNHGTSCLTGIEEMEQHHFLRTQ